MTTNPMMPMTLLQIAGAPPLAARLDQSVLVIVDAQNEYVSGRLPLDGVGDAIAQISTLLAAARAKGTPVIHVVQHSAPGRPLFDPDTAAAAIVPELTPIEDESIVVKRLPNAFAGTPLQALLQARGVGPGQRSMLLVGFMTHMCISATARAALDLGIASAVVAAATATRAIPNPSGGVIEAEVVHETALAELADRFATVVRNAAAVLFEDAA